MELFKFRIDGLYDLRTLKELKAEGVDHFCFDFNPRSFNFVPEHVFLDLFIKVLSDMDKIFLHFVNNKDPMVLKISSEMKKRRGNLQNIFFEFDEYFNDYELPSEIKFLQLYGNSLFSLQKNLDNLAGFIFPYEQLAKLQDEAQLIKFYSNFFTHFNSYQLDSKLFVLKLGWNDKVTSACVDVFDFNIISLTLNSEVEVCYRNIDIIKLKTKFNSQMKMFKNQIEM